MKMTNKPFATHALHLKCGCCEKTDIVLKQDALNWKCPFCLFEKNQCQAALHDELYKIEHLIAKIERLNDNCTDNMKRLNSMMLELKGIIAMVRPMAKKNEWYGEEISVKLNNIKEGMSLEETNSLKKLFNGKEEINVKVNAYARMEPETEQITLSKNLPDHPTSLISTVYPKD